MAMLNSPQQPIVGVSSSPNFGAQNFFYGSNASDTHPFRGARSAAQIPVTPNIYDKILQYNQFSAAAYAVDCETPPFGSRILKYFDDPQTDTQAYLYRWPSANEVILAFRGTESVRDLDTDISWQLVPLNAPGTDCSTCKVHKGFSEAYASVAEEIVQTLHNEEYCNPSASLIVTGHSLGGAIASIASVSLKGLGLDPTVYTYGEPRNGNPAFAHYADAMISPERHFRVTHANDGVPQIPPKMLGYQHHGIEYWQSHDRTNGPETTFRCEGVDPEHCNAQADPGPAPINSAHLWYSDSLIANILNIAACGAKYPVKRQ
ncbi:ferulic acid esterase A faeA [Phyllosticta capitalensis]